MMVALTNARRALDLTCYAIRVVGSDEYVSVGLNPIEAEAFCNSFNSTMDDCQVEKVKIRWEPEED
jgi:hypothetical protein